MKTNGNTVLITGGATGIGFALAEAFTKADNTVIICGRRESKLVEAKQKMPRAHIKVIDVASEKNRNTLFTWVQSNFGKFNILINNAGVQKDIDFTEGARDLTGKTSEIEINFAAPVALCAMFIPGLMKQRESAIINVSSGLGFVPIASMPVYCATKAALHMFTVSLRHQLRESPVKVFEIIPPMVDTDLGRGANEEPGEGGFRGMPPAELAAEFMAALAKDQFEVPIGQAKDLAAAASIKDFEQAFQRMNSR